MIRNKSKQSISVFGGHAILKNKELKAFIII
jgi:hypothetical protein